jgi:hypothetical protein
MRIKKEETDKADKAEYQRMNTPNPFTEQLTVPLEEYPQFLEDFWVSLPDSSLSPWKYERAAIAAIMEQIQKEEEKLKALRIAAREQCEEVGGRMWDSACILWGESEARKALKRLL